MLLRIMFLRIVMLWWFIVWWVLRVLECWGLSDGVLMLINLMLCLVRYLMVVGVIV